MRFLLFPVLLALSAHPALAFSEAPAPRSEKVAVAERLFPDVDPEGEGWRELLPIMLMDANLDVQRQSAGNDRLGPPAR